MSTGLSTAFITLFEAEVKQAYQGESVLNNSVRMRTNVQGSTVKFPKIGKGVSQIRTPQTDVVPLNTDFSSNDAPASRCKTRRSRQEYRLSPEA